jgi:hypothetical protein
MAIPSRSQRTILPWSEACIGIRATAPTSTPVATSRSAMRASTHWKRISGAHTSRWNLPARRVTKTCALTHECRLLPDLPNRSVCRRQPIARLRVANGIGQRQTSGTCLCR